MELNFIKQYIENKFDEGLIGTEIAEQLGVSVSMISSYRNHKYNPSLKVAKTVYRDDNVVLHPYSEDSLKFEMKESK